MTPGEVMQVVGSIGLIAFGLLLFRITAGRWWCRFGREALVLAAVAIMSSAIVRLLVVPCGVLSQDHARIVNGFLMIGYLAILLQLMYLQRFVEKR